MGDAAGIRAGRAFVEIGGNDAPFLKTLRSTEHHLSSFAGAVKSLALYELGQKVLAPVIEQFTAMGVAMEHAALKTGMTVEEISGLGYAAQVSGVEMGALEMGIARMSREIAKAVNGSAEANEALKRLGLSADQLASLSQSDRFKLFAQQIATIPDPSMRAAAALETFGRGGYQLLPMLSKGAAGIQEAKDEAERFGFIVSEEAAAAAHELDKAMIALHLSLKMTVFTLGMELQPLLLESVEWIRVHVSATAEWIKGHKELIVSLGEVAAGTLLVTRALALLATQAGRTNIALGLIGYLAFSVTDGFGMLAESAEYAAQKAAKVREEGDKQRATALSLMDRLSELNAQEELSNRQKTEASNIVDTLAKKYGVFGITIDGVTGKLINLDLAQRRANESMTKAAADQLRKEIKALDAQVQAADLNWFQRGWFGAGAIIGVSQTPNEKERLARAKPLLDMQEKIARLRQLLGGDTEALTAGAAAAGVAGLPPVSDPKAYAAEVRKLDSEISKARVAMIEDEAQRKRSERDLAHQEELAKINELNVDAQQKAELRHKSEMAYTFQILGWERELKDKLAKEDEKQMQEVWEQDQRRAERSMELQDEMAKAQAELDLQGMDRRLKILDIEQDAALRKADVEAGEADQILALFGLRRQLERRRGETLTSQMAFNPWALRGMGGGPMQQIADNTKRGADAGVALVKKVGRMETMVWKP
jgi:hypothetical protein